MTLHEGRHRVADLAPSRRAHRGIVFGFALALIGGGLGIALNDPTIASGAPTPAIECPTIVAHATNAGGAPENTVAGLNSVRGTGTGWVEMDVRWSAGAGTQSNPGYPVAIHDTTVDRTTASVGTVADLGLSQLTSMDASAYTPWTTPGKKAGLVGKTTIPYAWDFFNAINANDLQVQMDVKVTPTEWGAKKLLEYADRWPGMRNRLWYMGTEESIREMRKWAGSTLHYVYINYPPKNFIANPDFLKGLDVDAYALPSRELSADPAKAAMYHSNGIQVWTWTSDPGQDTPEIRARMRAADVDMLTTNQPGLALLECQQSHPPVPAPTTRPVETVPAPVPTEPTPATEPAGGN